MLERVRNPAAGYAAALVFLSLAIALRWAFDPWLDSRQPFAFSQVTPALDRAQGGLSIGLALVQGLAELHGGSIRAHSAGGGRGSEFVLRLPCLAQSDAPRQAESMGSAND